MNFEKLLSGAQVVQKYNSRLQEKISINQKTMEIVLAQTFECQRCGACCTDSDCRSFNGKNHCRIFRKKNFPLDCRTYPFRPDMFVIGGVGYKYVQKHDQINAEKLKKNYVWFELGCVSGALSLDLFPSDPGFGKGNKTLAEHALSFLDKYFHNCDYLPFKTICEKVVQQRNKV